MTEARSVVSRLRWQELPPEARFRLARKLEGLYGAARDEEAFDGLAVDKQQALLLLARRFDDLGLWDFVRRVENVYGKGGVGMNFSAWPGLLSGLRGRKDFSTLFASHRDNDGGFRELGRRRAALHFLYQERGAGRAWAVHFDFYNLLSSPADAWRHLLYEEMKGLKPDWRAVRAALQTEW